MKKMASIDIFDEILPSKTIQLWVLSQKVLRKTVFAVFCAQKSMTEAIIIAKLVKNAFFGHLFDFCMFLLFFCVQNP